MKTVLESLPQEVQPGLKKSNTKQRNSFKQKKKNQEHLKYALDLVSNNFGDKL